jgi:hypothetical protein
VNRIQVEANFPTSTRYAFDHERPLYFDCLPLVAVSTLSGDDNDDFVWEANAEYLSMKGVLLFVIQVPCHSKSS